MLFRTHIAVTFFFVFVFFNYISNPLLFFPIVFLATLIPDIDSRFSKIGKKKIFRIFNFFVKHRGIIHSFTFLFLVSVPIFFFFKQALLPFASAYSLHLVLDALTVQGIPALFPLKFRIRGKIKTGGIFEKFLFYAFFFADLFLLFIIIYSLL